MKIYCEHTEDSGMYCTFPCLEYHELNVTIVSRHRERNLKEVRHENVIPLQKLLSLAVAEGNGEKLLKTILAEMGKSTLTEVFESV